MGKKHRNSKKVRRNDLCPCGSGKKYKYCCLSKYLNLTLKLPLHELDLLKEEFKKYNLSELVPMLSGLQLLPENQSHTIRLEMAIQIACSLQHVGGLSIDLVTLKNILNKYLPTNGSIGLLEDPPESLFTENIVFFGGNYIVYPGVTEERYFLSVLLESIHLNEKDFPIDFILNVDTSALSLLTLSDEIASRAGHCRNMKSLDTWKTDITTTDEIQSQKLSSSVVFTKKEIDQLLRKHGLTKDFLIPFIIPIGNDVFADPSIESNPLILLPLIEIEDKIVVANPGSIASCLRHYIWVTANRYNAVKVLAEKYKNILWKNAQEYFRLMQFEPLNVDLPVLKDNLLIKEQIFRIDSDKIAYVQLIVDNCDEYSVKDPYKEWKPVALSRSLFSRDKLINQHLKKINDFLNNDIFAIKIFGGIGRPAQIEIHSQENQVLHISIEDLEVVSKVGDLDSLSLWKYAKAETKYNFSPISTFLDKFSVYFEHNYSFYLDDRIKPTHLLLFPGTGMDLKIKVKHMWDEHASLTSDSHNFENVVRRYLKSDIPIYVPKYDFGRYSYQLIEGYLQPIWVGPRSFPKLNETNFQFTETLSYWLWQLTPSLKEHLSPLGGTSITIMFSLGEPEKWVNLKRSGINTDLSSLPFSSKVRDFFIEFEIPNEIEPFLQRQDNLGERLMLESLMQALGELLKSKSLNNTLNITEIRHLLDIHAPLGMKKKIFTVDTSYNARLDNLYIPMVRKLQKHDVQEQMDELVNELDKRKYPVGRVIESKKEKEELCNKIVDIYYNRLKSIISLYSWESLIKRFITYNEALSNYKALKDLTTVTTIECFTGVPLKVAEELEETQVITSTALSLRTLIEIVSAEPPTGNKELSIADFDMLLAITDCLLNWSMVSDHIHNKIIDHELSILESGRIGIDKEAFDKVYNPFMKNKILEHLEHSISSFKINLILNQEEKADLDPIYEAAFKEEFGLFLSQIVDFYHSLMEIGFDQRVATPSLHLLDLKLKLKNVLNWDDETIDTAIKLFSLSPRKKWEIPPDGFESNDIWPWRYNRRLSYIRRPLVIGPKVEENQLVFWGPRHVEEACINLIGLVTTGRYHINESTSEKMKSLIGTIINEKGKKFTQKVEQWFIDKTSCKVDHEIPIKPGKKLNAEIDLGDIDVLVIDEKSNRILLVECKDLNYGRNPQEIANEIERLIGDSKEDNSWTKKHIKRHEWVKANVDILIRAYGLKNETFSVHSLFIVSNEIPAPYVRSMPLPFIPYSYLVREGLNSLNDIYGK
jgi:Predicted metal-binding protein related to the C-terminal domain of SecA